MERGRLFVLGGSGYVGREAVREAVAQGWKGTALAGGRAAAFAPRASAVTFQPGATATRTASRPTKPLPPSTNSLPRSIAFLPSLARAHRRDAATPSGVAPTSSALSPSAFDRSRAPGSPPARAPIPLPRRSRASARAGP